MKADVQERPGAAGAGHVVADRVIGDVVLAVDNVSLAFGGVKAITDVSFDIRKGEIRAIIGPNGAGKTSMLNVINGFYHPNQGTITFKGKKTGLKCKTYKDDVCKIVDDEYEAKERADFTFRMS